MREPASADDRLRSAAGALFFEVEVLSAWDQHEDDLSKTYTETLRGVLELRGRLA